MAYGPSILITTAPAFSITGAASGQITVNLTSIPTNAAAVTFAHRARRTGVWVIATSRVATGSFDITGLTDGETYDVLALPQEAGGELGPASGTQRVALSGGESVFGVEELLDAIEDVFKAMVWPGSANKVFGNSVQQVGNPGLLEEEIANLPPPAALIYDLGSAGSFADENPGFSLQRIGVTAMVIVNGDLFGTKALKGANRSSEIVSAGAGIFDVHDAIMRDAAKLLRNSTYPVRFLSKFSSAAGTARVNESKSCASKSYTIIAALKEGS